MENLGINNSLQFKEEKRNGSPFIPILGQLFTNILRQEPATEFILSSFTFYFFLCTAPSTVPRFPLQQNVPQPPPPRSSSPVFYMPQVTTLLEAMSNGLLNHWSTKAALLLPLHIKCAPHTPHTAHAPHTPACPALPRPWLWCPCPSSRSKGWCCDAGCRL